MYFKITCDNYPRQLPLIMSINESFVSTMSKLVIWVILPSVLFKLVLIYQKLSEILELLFWILRTDYIPLEKFRLRIIYSVKMLIFDLLRNSHSKGEGDQGEGKVAFIWPANQDEDDWCNNDCEVFEEPPIEEIQVSSTTSSARTRRNNRAPRNRIVLPPAAAN